MGTIEIVVAISGFDVDHVDRFTEVIETLSGADDVTVTITHVYGEDDRERIAQQYDVNLDQPTHVSAVAEHNNAVQELSSALDDRGIAYTVRGSIGDPASEILAIADDEQPDFVLVGGRERSPAGKAIFGSTSQSVLLQSEWPVIFVGGATGE